MNATAGMEGILLRPGLTPPGNQISREQRESIEYFVNHLVSKRAMIPVEQSGLYMLIARAFQQPEVMAAVLASSAAHKMQLSRSPPHTVQFEYIDALKSFSQYLQSGQDDFERGATCAILLAVTDTVNSGTGDWYHHLRGAIAIVNGARGKIDPGNVIYHRFLTRFLIYHDVVAAVTMSTPPRLDPTFYEQEEQQVVSDNVHSIAGANSLLLTIIARICRLKAKADENMSVDLRLLYSEAGNIEQRLRAVSSGGSCGLPFEILLEVYRASALLLLYRTLEIFEESPALIDTLATKSESSHEDLMGYLQRISVHTALSPALVFPLFIAGLGATSKAQQTLIHDQIRDLYSRLHFGNIRSVLSILEEIWSSGAPNPSLAWRSFIQRRNWKLALA